MMKEVSIACQDHFDVKSSSLDNRDNNLDAVQEKKKNNTAKILKKILDQKDISSQNKSLFEKILLTVPNADSNICTNEEISFENAVENNPCTENLCHNPLDELIMRDITSNEENDCLIKDSSEVCSRIAKDIYNSSTIALRDFLIIDKIDGEHSDFLLKSTVALLQLKTSPDSMELLPLGLESDSTSSDLRQGKENFSKDKPCKAVGFLIEEKLTTVSEDKEIRNLELFPIFRRLYNDGIGSFPSTENALNQKFAMRFTMIPEHVHYIDRGSIKTLKIQMKPNSPDNVVATLSLSGDKLSIKLQVESDYLYKKIQNERQGILDSLNFSGYTMDHFDVDFRSKDTVNLYQDSINYFSQQQGFKQSDDFERKKVHFPEKGRVEKKVFWGEKRTGIIYNNGEYIGMYSEYIYV
ncbi:hypothetical protein AP064_01720 [Candidatus Liberibacter solanacearum]|uniref:Flagellar hook-length control protein FliK n=1 Tax=Candidatus Liberibacter solanacearum TaxID=556287 RepID=A0A0F4VLM9_9HYPH|nr:flagellar hook-length control protein FliK [Candidatus Liberibacter solanacearum]KJZ82418.1 hypothetical protein DJ66_0018 [Candidatus Liberibacter solanacearum]KQC49209.1 hypothetical protein AP064_01720 [Candidatus Liberibacter solanacearum]